MNTSVLDEAVTACFEGIYDSCSVAAGTPVSLYDMGMVDGWTLSADGVLTVRLCVTFGACTMVPHFVRAAEETLSRLDGVRKVDVAVDTSILWSVERMSAKGRALLESRPARFTARDMPRPRQWQEREASEAAAGHHAGADRQSQTIAGAPGAAR